MYLSPALSPRARQIPVPQSPDWSLRSDPHTDLRVITGVETSQLPGSTGPTTVRVQLLVIPWTIAFQAPLTMEFSWQEYCSELPFPSRGDLADPGIEALSLVSPTLAGRFFTTGNT